MENPSQSDPTPGMGVFWGVMRNTNPIRPARRATRPTCSFPSGAVRHAPAPAARPRSIMAESLAECADFVLGALPVLGAIGGIAALVIVPLWWAARSLGVC